MGARGTAHSRWVVARVVRRGQDVGVRVVDLERRRIGPNTRIQARIVGEGRDAPSGELWFESPEDRARGLVLRGDAFLLGTLVPAMAAGEERILVEGQVCPVLAHGVAAAARILARWSPGWRLPAIEAQGGFAPAAGPSAPRTASTLAGGTDSLATLRRNRLDLPLDHPASIRDVFFVFGFNSFDFEGDEPVAARERDFAVRLQRWQPLAAEAGVDILPVRTNLRTFAPSFPVWARRTMGAALSAVAHAFSGRITRFLIPSAGRADPLHVDGTHPALDPLYAGAVLQVVHDGLDLPRLEKLELLADWDAAMAVLQPCQQVELQDATINCGNCNKCRRTMLGLEAIGRLAGNTTFPRDRIDGAWVDGMRIAQAFDFDYLEALLPRLAARGRPDLVEAIRRRRRAWERQQRVGAARRLRRWLRQRRGERA